MKFGYFDDKNKEYVITTPKTPLPWINYLGSEGFFTLLSNTAGGYAFYRDARLRRITRYRYNNNPMDMEGFRVYIREASAKGSTAGTDRSKARKGAEGGATVWNPGWFPTQEELDSYKCRHGLGYTVIEGSKNGLQVQQTFLVPRKDNCLLMRLTLTNQSQEQKELDVFSFVEFCLWDAMDDSSNFQRNYSCGEVEIEPNALYHKTEYRERRDHYAVYWSNENYDGFDTSRDAFCGMYGGVTKPEAVDRGCCSGSIAHGWAPVGAMQFHVILDPGENRELLIGLGYIENARGEKFEAPAVSDTAADDAGQEEPWATYNIINKKKAHAMMDRYQTPEAFQECLSDLREYWTDLLSHYQASVQTGDSLSTEKLNRMVNIWNQYQCMVTFNMSRSASYFESGMGRGMGFRDSCQDLLGFVHIIPERARERILDIAATQFPDGSAYHQYQPLTKKGNLAVGSGFNDDPLWLVAGVEAYLAETGDYSILKEMVDFDNDPSQAASLLEHLRRSVGYVLTHLGPHKLPLIGRADWNDCLNLNCFSDTPGESFQTTGPSEGPMAESVFIGGMFVKYGKAYAHILRMLAEQAAQTETADDEDKELLAEAKKIEKAVKNMEKAILTDGWDGEWFLRAYDAFGNPVGSSSCAEGQIYIEPQGMCVMAEVGKDSGEAEKALQSVKERLDTRYGIVLLQPAYTTYHLNLGEISSYPPGYKENAGIFCHNNPWIVCAETVLGHGDRAFEIYQKTCPSFIEEISEIHRTEPYVYSQMVAGIDAPTFGEAKNSWLTGTAAWTFACVSQYILGVKPVLEGLQVRPVIPSEWLGLHIVRKFRGTTYHITVDNEAHVQHGITAALINGEPVKLTDPDAVILPPADASDVEVVITMG